MITITPDAQEKLTAYLAESKVAPKVRIYLPSCDCSGSGEPISLTLDEPTETDIKVQAGELELFISPELFAQTGKVEITFKDDGRNSGFVVDSEKTIDAGPSPCSSCTSCG
ncbi:MAG: iron-sulfur cluster biosynthesis family protein [Candidatus Adiutrix sp.]